MTENAICVLPTHRVARVAMLPFLIQSSELQDLAGRNQRVVGWELHEANCLMISPSRSSNDQSIPIRAISENNAAHSGLVQTC